MPKSNGPSMTSIAYDRIKAGILDGRHAPDDKIKISDLVKSLGYSLGAVREALSRLGSEGLVVPETNKGYRVAKITEAELADLTNLRIMIEGECLANAIAHGDLKWESGIVAAEFALSRLTPHLPGDGLHRNPEWAVAHRQFHEALVASCDSPWLLRVRDMLFVQSERYRAATLPFDRAARDLSAEHAELAQLVLAHDIVGAQAAITAHFRKTMQILLDAGVARRL